jgi:rhodanese-related sulfurtransferase
MASEQGGDVIVMDVRSHGYYDPGASRIAGSIRLEPNRLAEEIKSLPNDKDIYIYCS